MGDIPRAGNLTNISNAFTFSWNPADMYRLTFYATDLLGAIEILRPKVYMCSCLNGGNCTWDGTLNSTQNITIMQCNCSPGEPWTTLNWFPSHPHHLTLGSSPLPYVSPKPAWEGALCDTDADGCISVSAKIKACNGSCQCDCFNGYIQKYKVCVRGRL